MEDAKNKLFLKYHDKDYLDSILLQLIKLANGKEQKKMEIE